MMNEHKIKTTLRRLNEKAIPSTLDGWSSIEKRLTERNRQTNHQTKPAFKRRIALKLVNVTIIFAVAIAGLWLLRPQQTISASQIMLKAAEAQQSNAFGLKGYQGIIRKQLHNGTIQTEEHIWREFPDNRRAEVYMNPLPQPVVQHIDPSVALSSASDKSLTLSRIDIANDVDRFWYSLDVYGVTRTATNQIVYESGSKTYRFIDVGGGMYSHGIGNLWLNDPQSVDSLLDNVERKSTDLKLAGTETIAGRSAYVLTFTAKRSLYGTLAPTLITAWIDQESFLLLGERWESIDKKQSSEWRFTSIALNPTFDNEIFSFKALPNVLVLFPDLELYISPDAYGFDNLLKPGDFERLIQTLQQQVNYKIYLPDTYTALPGLMTSPPIHTPASGDITTLKYQSPDNGMALVILQGTPTVMRQVDPCARNKAAACEAVTFGAFNGQYVESIEKNSFRSVGDGYEHLSDPKTAIVRWLSFERDGTYILLRAEYDPRFKNIEVSKADLLKVAASLQEAKP